MLRWSIFVVSSMMASPLHAQGYCAQFSDGTSPDCSFPTLQMCMASVTGLGGVCMNNPYPQTATAAPPPPPLPLPPGQTKYQLFPTTSPTVPTPPPCNPVIDGTYCATAGGDSVPSAAAVPSGMAPISSISTDLGLGNSSPATLGGLTFSGGTNCIALFRRMSCGG